MGVMSEIDIEIQNLRLSGSKALSYLEHEISNLACANRKLCEENSELKDAMKKMERSLIRL